MGFSQPKHSFTLLELSVALAVSGVLIAGGITAYKSTNPKLRSDLKKMEKIEEALQQFFTTNGRLPFPARPSDYNGTTYYLKEYKIGNATKYSKATYRTTSSGSNTQTTNTQYCNSDSCTSYAGGISAPTSQMIWGVVPTRTLGLPDDYAYDSKGKNFEYITDLQLATNNGISFGNSYKKANYATNQQGTYEVLYTTTNTSYTSFTMPLFPLAIYSNNASRVVDGTSKNIAYVILSKQNQSCFWNNRGKTATITNSTIPSNNTKYNCQANYSNGAPTSINIYQGYSKTFDNVVRTKRISQLVENSYKSQENAQGIYSKTSSSTSGYFNALPVGTMVLFYLNSNSIPKGWQICNGTNGTPDMRGYLATGATDNNNLNKTAGDNTKKFTITANQMPKHTHTATIGKSDSYTVTTSRHNGHHHNMSHQHQTYWKAGFRVHYDDEDNKNMVECIPSEKDAGRCEESYEKQTSSRRVLSNEDSSGSQRATITLKGTYPSSWSQENTGDAVEHEHTVDIGKHEHTITINNAGKGEEISLDITNKNRKVYYICKIA